MGKRNSCNVIKGLTEILVLMTEAALRRGTVQWDERGWWPQVVPGGRGGQVGCEEVFLLGKSGDTSALTARGVGGHGNRRCGTEGCGLVAILVVGK